LNKQNKTHTQLSARTSHKPNKADAAELPRLASVVLGDRNEAVRGGMVVNGARYEVHRHHPPLAYGRTMGARDPDDSVGAALCAVVDGTATGQPCFGFITYRCVCAGGCVCAGVRLRGCGSISFVMGDVKR
jgi:hypothetical protein